MVGLLTSNEITRALKSRFMWESDGKLDSFHIMAAEGPVSGDCSNFVLTFYVLKQYT